MVEPDKLRSRGAFLVTMAVLIIATAILANANRKGADDTPLEGDKTTSAVASGKTTPPTPDMYAEPLACDGFSEQVLTEILTTAIEVNTPDGDSRKCVWETPNQETIRATTTWFPTGTTPDSATKAQQKVGAGGIPINQQLGDGGRIYDCSGELCQLVFSHSNVVVQLIIDADISENPTDYVIRLGQNFAGTSFQGG
ncbi:MAG: hypothetical protein HOQ05_06880 [Corynebacteriales bacterium]|nr:hypothetical protein [Mycobacteriales bacterium]